MSEMADVETAQRLKEMQALDTAIIGLRRKIEGLPEEHRLGELEEKLASARADLAERKDQLADVEHRQHKLDGELEVLVEKMKGEEGKLFSGTIMNPKELQAIQAEIFALRKRRDEMETEDLELMEETDSLGNSAGELEANVGDTERALAEANERHDADLAELEAQISVLEEERDGIKQKVDPEVVATYEKLLADKGGLAVTDIEAGRVCNGCHMEFSRTQIDRIQHGEGIFRCDYCRRILVK